LSHAVTGWLDQQFDYQSSLVAISLVTQNAVTVVSQVLCRRSANIA
jgi:hypothetical protein